MYILVVVVDGSIDNTTGFTDYDEAVLAADDAAAEFDMEDNPGDVAVFDLNVKTGEMKQVYAPKIENDSGEEE